MRILICTAVVFVLTGSCLFGRFGTCLHCSRIVSFERFLVAYLILSGFVTLAGLGRHLLQGSVHSCISRAPDPHVALFTSGLSSYTAYRVDSKSGHFPLFLVSTDELEVFPLGCQTFSVSSPLPCLQGRGFSNHQRQDDRPHRTSGTWRPSSSLVHSASLLGIANGHGVQSSLGGFSFSIFFPALPLLVLKVWR